MIVRVKAQSIAEGGDGDHNAHTHTPAAEPGIHGHFASSLVEIYLDYHISVKEYTDLNVWVCSEKAVLGGTLSGELARVVRVGSGLPRVH